jgi:dimethylhistidine N-methyltransferase
MELEEYYLTRCELEIFQSRCHELDSLLSGSAFNVVELGSGDGFKTIFLLKHLVNSSYDFRYVPVDISEQAMRDLSESLVHELPELAMHGLVAEYFDALKWLNKNSKRRNFVLFLGSNLGNYTADEALKFLRSLWYSLNDGDYLLIGLDLTKDADIMQRAYLDSKGVTARFNLNLLHRINKELGGHFSVEDFEFQCNYNFLTGAIESYLVSRKDQTVIIDDLECSFEFKEWEVIHTEYSHKYSRAQISEMASQSGFDIEIQLYDSKQYFVDSVWRVRKEVRA